MNLRTSLLAFIPIVAIGCGGGSGGNAGSGTDGGSSSGGGSGSSGGSGGSSGGGSGSSSGGGSGSSSGGGSGGSSGGGSGSSSGGTPTGGNVAPLIVDNGPTGGGGSIDVPFVTVTICVPGTSTCQTIDHVAVDTGSEGLRVVSSVLTLSLPQAKATTGDSLAECQQFDIGFTWGSVRNADVKIAGEVAANIPINVLGDPGFTTIPSDCSAGGGQSMNTVMDLGGNGLIGINQIVPDCGTYCASPGPTAEYYSCATSSTCADVEVAVAAQISNPIAFFSQDKNGAIMQFPTVPATGAASLAGSLVFGIGTQSNNALGSAKVLTLDEYGSFTTTFNGTSIPGSFVDSGTNSLSFNDSSIATCSGDTGWFCPTSPVTLMATNVGLNNVSSDVSFTVYDADTLFAANVSAVDDLAGPWGTVTANDPNAFDWGFPFFIGRNVYLALDGATTSGGAGPYVAY
jgi:hypothetical protein